MKESILLTGHSGFVGSNLLKQLGSKHNWIGLGRTAKKTEGLDEAFTWDQMNEALSVSNLKVIIHAAGKAHDTSNTADEEVYYEVNRDLTVKLFEEFVKSKAETFIFFSSVKAVADEPEGIVSEETLPSPRTPYGRSKYEAEQILLQRIPAGKKVVILRPCMIHGPGNKGNLNLLYGFAKRGLPYPLASFKNQRSYLYIENLAYIIQHLVSNSEIKSGTYNLADDATLSTNQLMVLIGEVLGKKAKLWHFPISFIKRLTQLGDALKLPLNSDTLKKLTGSYVVSNQKIKNELGITILPTDVKQGLKTTMNWFKNN